MHELLRRGNFLNHSSLLYRSSAIHALLGMSGPYIDYQIHIRPLRHGELCYINKPLVGYRWRTKSSMIKTMPRAVYDGHMDVFREAVDARADYRDIQSAIGRFWGKLLLQAILTRKWSYLNEWRRRLLIEPELHFSNSAMVAATLMSLPQAVASFYRRHVGPDDRAIFFP